MAENPEAVARLAAEMKDRFGEYPRPVRLLMLTSELRCLAEQKGISVVETEGNRLKLKIARAKGDKYVKIGARFPRLTKQNALGRVKEIQSFLKRYSAAV